MASIHAGADHRRALAAPALQLLDLPRDAPSAALTGLRFIPEALAEDVRQRNTVLDDCFYDVGSVTDAKALERRYLSASVCLAGRGCGAAACRTGRGDNLEISSRKCR